MSYWSRWVLPTCTRLPGRKTSWTISLQQQRHSCAARSRKPRRCVLESLSTTQNAIIVIVIILIAISYVAYTIPSTAA